MRKELPNLPYGEGSFDYNGSKIRYRKSYINQYDHKKYALSVQGTTPRECIVLMQEKIKKHEQKIKETFRHNLDNETVTLTDGIDEWLKTFKFNKNKANTYDREERTLRNQIAPFAIGKMRITDVSERDIQKHFQTLINEKHYSNSTIKKTYDTLNQFFKYYYRGDINRNPMNYVERPRPIQEIGEIDIENDLSPVDADFVLSNEEITVFKNECYKSKSKYDIGIYFILLMCLRVGEACALFWRDVDIENKTLRITKSLSTIKNRDEDPGDGTYRKTKTILTTPKSKSSTRNLLMPDEAIEAIQDYRKQCEFTEFSDYVFATANRKPAGKQRILLRVKALINSAGLNANGLRDSFSPHDLRHTGISYYIRNGVPIDIVSKFAGHSSSAITTRVYYHIIEDQKKEGVNLMNTIKR